MNDERIDYFFAVLDAELGNNKSPKEALEEAVESYAAVFYDYDEKKIEIRSEAQKQCDVLQGYLEVIQKKIEFYGEKLLNTREVAIQDFRNILMTKFHGDQKKIQKSFKSVNFNTLALLKEKYLLKNQLEWIELRESIKKDIIRLKGEE